MLGCSAMQLDSARPSSTTAPPTETWVWNKIMHLCSSCFRKGTTKHLSIIIISGWHLTLFSTWSAALRNKQKSQFTNLFLLENSYCPKDSDANCDATLALSFWPKKEQKDQILPSQMSEKCICWGNYSAVLNGHWALKPFPSCSQQRSRMAALPLLSFHFRRIRASSRRSYTQRGLLVGSGNGLSAFISVMGSSPLDAEHLWQTNLKVTDSV